ncbi:MAG: four helix bundle protein [Candidatus Omnitrophota bacterium]
MAYTFKNIKVWQRAHSLVLEIYKVTKTFPKNEQYGLSAQVRRSASSIATNIVEGYKRRSRKEFNHFLNIADSSLEETKYHLLLSLELFYLSRQDYEKLSVLSDEVGRMLAGFQKSLKLTTYNL